MKRATVDMLNRLQQAGISNSDAYKLHRIAITLHRWHELVCGDDRGFVIERDEADENRPYMVYHSGMGKPARVRVDDRERDAEKRLAQIMSGYPGFRFYVQTDPRGAPLYIIPPDAVPEGADLSQHYTKGIAVHR